MRALFVKRVRLISESILESFASTIFVNQDRLYRLWLVAPWIGYEEAKADPILSIIEAVRRSSCSTIVITRPPKDAWHVRAVELLRANVRPTIFHCPTLHTKLYILECNGFRCAVLGSPNLTPRANAENRELAVEFRTTVESPKDDIAGLIGELMEYASELRQISELA